METPHFEESQGDIEFSVPAAGKQCKTHYWLYGSLKKPGNSRPLVCLHGGPGVPHNYISPIKDLALSGTPVIFYDQLGCGKSTHLQEKKGDTAFWTVALFLDELDNLLAHFGIQDNYDLLGQSWGGMLASEHAIRQPKGLNKLVIADSPASMATWAEEANKLRAQLPKDVQEKLDKHEADGTTDSEEYEEAMMVFYDLHVCRVKPMPEELVSSFAQLKEDPTVYNTMNGPSEFTISGSLKTWSVVEKVHKINVPTLLINGRYDEATDVCVSQFFNSIPRVKWVRFAESSHMPQLEEPKECLKVIADFLK